MLRLRSAVERYLPYVILASGIAISLIQYFSNRSLWVDEARLALNIITKDSCDLMNPLDYYQVAPIGFLFIEKAFSIVIPGSELGLRLFPLISFWISLLHRPLKVTPLGRSKLTTPGPI